MLLREKDDNDPDANIPVHDAILTDLCRNDGLDFTIEQSLQSQLHRLLEMHASLIDMLHKKGHLENKDVLELLEGRYKEVED